MFILEAGKNHFGKKAEAKKIIKFFNTSSFRMLTFMCQRKNGMKKIKIKNKF